MPKRPRKLFGISCSADGWFIEKHPKLDPVATMTEGIFIAGCVTGPKDIPATVVAGRGRCGARAGPDPAEGDLRSSRCAPASIEDKCSGCRICNDLCPFNAITFHRRSHGDGDQSGAVPGLRHVRGGLPGGRDQRHGLQQRADPGADRRLADAQPGIRAANACRVGSRRKRD